MEFKLDNNYIWFENEEERGREREMEQHRTDTLARNIDSMSACVCENVISNNKLRKKIQMHKPMHDLEFSF